jgi:hypothetical protein
MRVLLYPALLFSAAGASLAAHRLAFVSDGYSWYQSGKVRVFFSADFTRELGPMGDGIEYSREFHETLGRLFRSGKLNGEMFQEQIGNSPAAVSHVATSDGSQHRPGDVFGAMEAYQGPLIKILNFKIFSRSETWLETITYELWVTTSRPENGWGEFHRFRVTIKKRFLLPPRLVKLEYSGSQI